MFVVHDTLPNQRKMKKKHCSLIKFSPFSKGNGVIFKNKNLLCMYCSRSIENTFFSGFSIKNFKLLNGPKFNWYISISFITKKKKKTHYKNP